MRRRQLPERPPTRGPLWSGVALLCLAGLCVPVAGAAAVNEHRPAPLLVEPDPAAPAGERPAFRPLADRQRAATVLRWLDHEGERRGVELYARALAAARSRGGANGALPELVIALDGGEDAAYVGLRLREGGALVDYPHGVYLRMAYEQWRFDDELLHEVGHVVLRLLAGGREIPRHDIAAIQHATPALTDRSTAFDEGFATHLETLFAFTTSDPDARRRYDHTALAFGILPGMQGEFFRPSADLVGFAQPITRFADVRDNAFAFAPAFSGPDYLRVQLEPARDRATLRDANQLLQAEGFYATFFFALTARGDEPPDQPTIAARQTRLFDALATLFERRDLSGDTPFLPVFCTVYASLFPAEASAVRDVILDLSRGVFVDAGAAALWREHYLAALRLDVPGLGLARLAEVRARWRALVARDPGALLARLGPQLATEVPDRSVTLVGLSETVPLRFDLNTVEEGVLHLVPGITDEEVARWIAARAAVPFASAADFLDRVHPSTAVAAALRLPAQPPPSPTNPPVRRGT